METMRVYEFSRICGLTAKELLGILKQAGFDVSSHMSMLSTQELEFLRKKLLALETTPMEKQTTKNSPSELLKQQEVSHKKTEIESENKAQKPQSEQKKESIIKEEFFSKKPSVEKITEGKKEAAPVTSHVAPLQLLLGL